MSEISQTEILKMTKVQNYCRGYKDAKKDTIDKIQQKMISLHTDMIVRYGSDTIEARCDTFDELEEWLKEQN